MLLDPGGRDVEPLSVCDPELQRQPVGDVDQFLVLHVAAPDVADQPVVQAREVGARVVDVVGHRLGQRSTGDEVAVAQGAQRLAQPLVGGVEAVVDQRPGARRLLGVPASDLLGGVPLLQQALRQREQGHVVQGRHHEVGARLGQQVLVLEPGHPDRGHPAGFGRLDTARRVLDHEAVSGRQAQLVRGGKEDHGVGLAAREIPAGEVGVEQLLQRHPLVEEVVVEPLPGCEGVQADPFEEQPGVLRRRRRGDPQPSGLHSEDEAQRVGECREPALVDEREDVLLLGRRVLLRPLIDVGHPEVGQRRPSAVHPRHPGHLLLVHRRGEAIGRPRGAVTDVAPLPLHQRLQGLPPGHLVGGINQNPVHVEDRTLEDRATLRHVAHRSLGLSLRRVCADP